MTADTRQRTDHAGTRRFSEGIEQRPDAREKRLTGGFSRGIERWPDTPRSGPSGASAAASITPSSPHDRTPGQP